MNIAEVNTGKGFWYYPGASKREWYLEKWVDFVLTRAIVWAEGLLGMK